jgi:hypothetical protein
MYAGQFAQTTKAFNYSIGRQVSHCRKFQVGDNQCETVIINSGKNIFRPLEVMQLYVDGIHYLADHSVPERRNKHLDGGQVNHEQSDTHVRVHTRGYYAIQCVQQADIPLPVCRGSSEL